MRLDHYIAALNELREIVGGDIPVVLAPTDEDVRAAPSPVADMIRVTVVDDDGRPFTSDLVVKVG